MSEDKKAIEQEMQNIQRVKDAIFEKERPVRTNMEQTIGDSLFDSLE